MRLKRFRSFLSYELGPCEHFGHNGCSARKLVSGPSASGACEDEGGDATVVTADTCRRHNNDQIPSRKQRAHPRGPPAHAGPTPCPSRAQAGPKACRRLYISCMDLGPSCMQTVELKNQTSKNPQN